MSQVGSIAVFNPPAGDGLVFRSIANYEEFKKAQAANDDEGYPAGKSSSAAT